MRSTYVYYPNVPTAAYICAAQMHGCRTFATGTTYGRKRMFDPLLVISLEQLISSQFHPLFLLGSTYYILKFRRKKKLQYKTIQKSPGAQN